MARDDYFVIVYQILSYLYQQLKKGKPEVLHHAQGDCLSMRQYLHGTSKTFAERCEGTNAFYLKEPVMVTKRRSLPRELLIPPGETLDEVLKERGITPKELAVRTGVSPAYVSGVLAGKKDISSNFAMALECTLGIPSSFWLNLQANYDVKRLRCRNLRSTK